MYAWCDWFFSRDIIIAILWGFSFLGVMQLTVNPDSRFAGGTSCSAIGFIFVCFLSVLMALACIWDVLVVVFILACVGHCILCPEYEYVPTEVACEA